MTDEPVGPERLLQLLGAGTGEVGRDLTKEGVL
jgi:hypothetical protein